MVSMFGKQTQKGQEMKQETFGKWIIKCFPFYYGYWIVVVGTLSKALSAPGQTPLLGSILDYIIEDLKMDKSSTAVLYTSATLLSSVSLPLIGYGIDRLGLRITGLINATCLASACIIMSQVVHEKALLTLFFYFIRFFGQGGMQLIGTTLISKWWIKHRGKMQGISGVGLSLSMTGLFTTLARLGCEKIGWRLTFVAIGFILIFLFLPSCFFFFLEPPEAYQMRPDKLPPLEDDKHVENGKVELEGKTFGYAIRSWTFWVTTIAGFVWAFNATSLFFNIIGILKQNIGEELTQKLVPALYLTISITSSITTLLAGFLFDALGPKYLIFTALVLQALSMWILALDRTAIGTICFAAAFGTSNGCVNNMAGVVHAYIFGRKHIGKISGLAYSSLVIGSALGPLTAIGLSHGKLYYNHVLMVLSAVPILNAVILACTPIKSLVEVGEGEAPKPEENLEMQNLLSNTSEDSDLEEVDL